MKARKEDIDELQSQIFDLASCCKLLKEKTQLMQEEMKELKLIVETKKGEYVSWLDLVSDHHLDVLCSALLFYSFESPNIDSRITATALHREVINEMRRRENETKK